MNFSVVIVTYNRKKHLEKCLLSIKDSIRTQYKFEVIIIFNGETSYLSSIKNQFPEYQCHYIPINSPAYARNYAVKKTQGEYIFFLDDDCSIPEDYFNKIDFTSGWDVLGGPDMTPHDATSFQKTLGHALSSPLCMGATYKRHTPTSIDLTKNSDESHLILCNLWFKRALFDKENYQFPNSFFRNEENHFLKILKKDSKIIHYNSSLYVYHFRKDNIIALGKSIFISGKCRIKSFFEIPEKKELIYFLPLTFLILFLYWIFNPSSVVGYLFGIYTLAVCIYMIVKNRVFHFEIILLHYFILITYSLGLIVGLTDLLEKILIPNYE